MEQVLEIPGLISSFDNTVAGVALYVDDVFTGVEADVDERLPDVFVRDAMSPHSGVSVSCNGNVEDDRDGGSRHYCRSVERSLDEGFCRSLG
jgi:hypothetical protein